MRATLTAISNMAYTKKTMLQERPLGYMSLTLLGGMFVGFGVILLVTIGGLLDPAGVPSMRILQGVTFGVALTMVIMAGADLFTGNNLVMTIGRLEGATTATDLIKVWTVSWFGNFLGSIIGALLYYYSGLHEGAIGQYIVKLAQYKIDHSFLELVMRGVLCNIFVCLAVFCAYKLNNEAAKILVIFCCIFPFITSGFEHSVANMTLFSMTYLIDSAAVPVTNIFHNLIPVSIGNAIGGALFVGLAFWLPNRR